MTTERPDAMTTRAVDLRLTGMTCAACAARIEKVLNRAEGVRAEVAHLDSVLHCDGEHRQGCTDAEAEHDHPHR